MFTSHDLLAGVVVPAVVAMTVLTLGWRLSRRQLGRRDSPTMLAELAVGLGFAAGWMSLLGRGDFPPLDATWWLLWVSVPAAVVVLTARLCGAPLEARLLVAALALAVLFALVAWPLVSVGGVDDEAMRWRVAALVALDWGSIAALDFLGQRLTFRRTQLIWLAAIGSTSVVLLLSGSQRLAQTELLLAGAGLGCLATTVLVGRAGDGAPLAAIVGVLHGGVVLCGTLYAELGVVSAALLLVAPAAAWLAEPLAHHRHGAEGVRRAAAQIGLVTAVAAVPMWLAWRAFAGTVE